MMGTKTGMGRLTFSGRQEYQVTPSYQDGICYGYAAICTCALGNHFLSPSGQHTADAQTHAYVYPTYTDAAAAIEAWQRQQAQRQAASSNSPPEQGV